MTGCNKATVIIYQIGYVDTYHVLISLRMEAGKGVKRGRKIGLFKTISLSSSPNSLNGWHITKPGKNHV